MTESVSEILKDAIKAEVLACQFYTRSQRQVSDREVLALFASLADDEAGHESELRMLYRDLVGEDAPAQVIQASAEKTNPIPHDPMAILRMAMGREERARNIYRFLAAQIDDQRAHGLLMRLESQEERHYDLLEMELKGRRAQPWSQIELDNWVRDD